MVEKMDIFDKSLSILQYGINVFEQLEPKETEHSKILTELLNTNGKHNRGNLFLKLFFEYVMNDNKIFDENKIWDITAEKGRYDILIKSSDNEYVFIIENKSNWATDQRNQLYRYWKELIKENKRIKRGLIIYLSPNRNKMPDNQTLESPDNSSDVISKNYIKVVFFNEHIINWLHECMKSVADEPCLFFYIKQYLDFWRIKMTNNYEDFNTIFRGSRIKWNNFLEMSKQLDGLKYSWWEQFFEKLGEKVDINDLWEYKYQPKHQGQWSIKEYKSEYFCLFLSLWQNRIIISLGISKDAKDDCAKISTFIENQGYNDILIKLFDKLENPINGINQALKYIEIFHFNGKDEDILRLAWDAHFEPENLYSAINERIQKLLNNQDFIKIMTEINRRIINKTLKP